MAKKKPEAPDVESEMIDKWGIQELPEDYEELESSYSMLADEYKGVMSPRIEINLRDIAVWRLKRKKRVEAGDIQGAKSYTAMIKSTMDSEGMKATDVKPLAEMRIDSIVDSLEKRGMMQEGKLVGFDDLAKILANARGHYENSLDVVDAMIFAIINTMRKNDDDPVYELLPQEAQIEDKKGELQQGVTQTEQETLQRLEMVVPQRE